MNAADIRARDLRHPSAVMENRSTAHENPAVRMKSGIWHFLPKTTDRGDLSFVHRLAPTDEIEEASIDVMLDHHLVGRLRNRNGAWRFPSRFFGLFAFRGEAILPGGADSFHAAIEYLRLAHGRLRHGMCFASPLIIDGEVGVRRLYSLDHFFYWDDFWRLDMAGRWSRLSHGHSMEEYWETDDRFVRLAKEAREHVSAVRENGNSCPISKIHVYDVRDGMIHPARCVHWTPEGEDWDRQGAATSIWLTPGP